MKLVKEETSLVVAGAWNPAILTPEWILRFGLEKDAGVPSRVQAAMPIGVLFEFPKFGLEDFAYIARTDALIMSPSAVSQDRFAVVETTAKRILDNLAHTPVTGVGHNFEFQDAEPDGEMLQSLSAAQQDIVDVAPEGFIVASNSIATSLRRDNLIINIQRYYDGARFGVKFNFHHPVSSAAEAAKVLAAENGYKSFNQNYLAAREIVQQLYGDIQDDEND